MNNPKSCTIEFVHTMLTAENLVGSFLSNGPMNAVKNTLVFKYDINTENYSYIGNVCVKVTSEAMEMICSATPGSLEHNERLKNICRDHLEKNIEKIKKQLIFVRDMNASLMTLKKVGERLANDAKKEFDRAYDKGRVSDFLSTFDPELFNQIIGRANRQPYKADDRKPVDMAATNTATASMTDQQKYDAIIHWIASSINETQLILCRDFAFELFCKRTNNADLYTKIIGAVDMKKQLLPS